MIEKGTYTVDEDEAIAIYREIQEIIADEVPYIPMIELPLSMVHPDWLMGIQTIPADSAYFFTARWSEPAD